MRPKRGYEAAAITKHEAPGRRDDARAVGETVLRSDTHGVRRDWLAWHYEADPAGPRWTGRRFLDALFYAYGKRWIAFIGWTYVVDPGPVLRGLPVPAPACPARGQAGASIITLPITHATGNIPVITTQNQAELETAR